MLAWDQKVTIASRVRNPWHSNFQAPYPISKRLHRAHRIKIYVLSSVGFTFSLALRADQEKSSMP